MQTLTVKDAKYGFGRLVDIARAVAVAVAKHERPAVDWRSVEEPAASSTPATPSSIRT